ncbi:mobilization protein [Phaeobacter sp. JH204A]|uniref:mobilization protein n=1 Tax=Phaeobacter sp. JH204A TaxID=3112502 RepID=UPI003A8A520D
MAETELERAEKRYAQAKARLQGLKARETTRQRKLDTRRKVILGGALLDLAERDSGAAAMLDRLVRNLPRPQDQKAFAGWERPGATPSPTSPSTASDPDADGAS